MKVNQRVAGALAGAALGATAVCVGPAQATTYNYVGNNYLSIVDDPLPTGTYTLSMSVSGSFTVAAPLLNVGADITAQVLSFSFFDGRSFITDANADVQSFIVTTDLSGNIVDAAVLLQTAQLAAVVGAQRWGMSINAAADQATIFECTAVSQVSCSAFGQDVAAASGPGTWFRQQSEIPIPAALPLFATGLGALGFLAYRRQRRTTA